MEEIVLDWILGLVAITLFIFVISLYKKVLIKEKKLNFLLRVSKKGSCVNLPHHSANLAKKQKQ